MANQYYIPKLIDIRVGYKCEVFTESVVNTDGSFMEKWEDFEVKDVPSLSGVTNAISEQACRTKYINRDDIVSTGWTFEEVLIPPPGSPEHTHLERFTRDHHFLIYDYIARVLLIGILMGDIYTICIQRFDCPSINEFTYIISALNLKL